MGILSWLILIPLAALIAVLLIPSERKDLIRYTALGATLLQLGLFLVWALPAYMEGGSGSYLLEENHGWISLSLGKWGVLNANYHLGVDGMSFLMVLLSVIIFPVAALSSFSIDRRVKAYFALFLLLNLAVIGCFTALDFLLFYIFYEFMLLPMFFLIGLWGGARREYAAIKFFIYTLFGSVFMLLIMLGLAFSYADPSATAVSAGYAPDLASVTPEILNAVRGDLLAGYVDPAMVSHSFDFSLLSQIDPVDGSPANLIPGTIFGLDGHVLGMNARNLAFLILFIGFAIKIPAVPLHTWLPDAHVEAPTPVSVILAAVLLKVGGYGILRICFGIFPGGAVEYSWLIALLGVVSIVYGALVAMAQTDFKALIAYSSISHMGFVLLGMASLNAAGMQGAVLQMFNHGIVSAALFLIVGVLYDRYHDRKIAHFKGLWNVMPRYTVVVLIAFFASMGLPGLNAFISEMLSLFGAFTSGYLSQIFAWVAVTGIVLSAVYYLRTFRAMFFGEAAYKGGDLRQGDMSLREGLLLIPLCLLMILFGIMPSLLIDLGSESIAGFADISEMAGQAISSMMEAP